MHNVPFYSVPMLNALLLVYKGLYLISFPYALGFSIILLTVVIRFILYPFTASQLKAAKKMQAVSGHLARLKEKHKGDSKTLQAETMKLYKEHGINPAAGCLPLLIQLPVIYSLYGALQNITSITPTVINKLTYFDFLKIAKPMDPYFFGISLGSNPSHLLSSLGPIVLLVPLLTALFQFIQSKMMLPQNSEEKKTEKKGDDFASAFASQSTYIFPIMIGFFSFTFPIGLSLYWNTFTIFGIIQQYKISGLGGLKWQLGKK